MSKVKKLLHKKITWVVLGLIVILSCVITYHTSLKALPEGISFEGDVHSMQDIEFYKDLTYENEAGDTVHEREIFQEIEQTIANAEDVIVADMFLFNSYTNGKHDFPEITKNLVDAIIEQKQRHPDLQAVFITDQINTVYGSYESEAIDRLRDNGVDVVLTNLNKLRDSNPIYSSIWRTFLQWFGQEGDGWIKNPLAKNAPDVTARSYLKLLNVKANHRKLIATENEAIVSTANPHEASGYHENVAFKMEGPIVKDILEAEKAVVDYSSDIDFPNIEELNFETQDGPLSTQFLTERKIYDAILEELEKVDETDEIWLGMYYLADRKIIDLIEAKADRGTQVNIVLDPNTKAFGHQKTGLPNLPVAAELKKMGEENLNIKWYDINMEQFHTKMLYIDKSEESVIISGSANYTRRNLANLNLEADVKIEGPSGHEVFREVDQYFTRIWENDDGHYTADYEEYQDQLTIARYISYHLQKLLWFTSY
ncbi:phospholipase D family protein [Thalassobacillus sp. CUG 92003]|uniref:phospholipase D family protein n=1 Tax=Thalassobacillus sp. CUG 92003 TaxID=2736641 RepID=UPI0015E6B493|nr:phospholipase D family protein [Thalassobacillus sp. CUG 92003]